MLSVRGRVEVHGDAFYNEWPEQQFHEILWAKQSELRANVAATQIEDFIQDRLTDDEVRARAFAAEQAGYANSEAYLQRMATDANMEAEAYASVEIEGPYVARYYDRPLACYQDDGTVTVCFPHSLRTLSFQRVNHPRDILNLTYHRRDNGEPLHGNDIRLDNAIVIRFVNQDHFEAVYFLDEPEPNAFAQTVPEFAVPSPALRTPLDAGKKFTFEDEFEQRLSVTPKSVSRPGLPETTPPRPRDSLSSPLAKQQRLLQPAQSQPSTSAKRQVTVPQKTVTSPARQTTTPHKEIRQPSIRSSVKGFSFTSPSPTSQQKTTTKRWKGLGSSPSTSSAQQQTQGTPPKMLPDIDWDLIRQSTGVDYLDHIYGCGKYSMDGGRGMEWKLRNPHRMGRKYLRQQDVEDWLRKRESEVGRIRPQQEQIEDQAQMERESQRLSQKFDQDLRERQASINQSAMLERQVEQQRIKEFHEEQRRVRHVIIDEDEPMEEESDDEQMEVEQQPPYRWGQRQRQDEEESLWSSEERTPPRREQVEPSAAQKTSPRTMTIFDHWNKQQEKPASQREQEPRPSVIQALARRLRNTIAEKLQNWKDMLSFSMPAPETSPWRSNQMSQLLGKLSTIQVPTTPVGQLNEEEMEELLAVLENIHVPATPIGQINERQVDNVLARLENIQAQTNTVGQLDEVQLVELLDMLDNIQVPTTPIGRPDEQLQASLPHVPKTTIGKKQKQPPQAEMDPAYRRPQTTGRPGQQQGDGGHPQQQPLQQHAGPSFQLPAGAKQTSHKNIWLLWDDIIPLHVDAIVNAANNRMLGGGGIDGKIHDAAGPSLRDECARLPQYAHDLRCQTGEAKITGSHNIRNVKNIIHTVGPQIEQGKKPTPAQEQQLRDCYISSLNLARQHGLRSIAFPCISIGIFHYPPLDSVRVATTAVNDWMRQNGNAMDAVIFCVYRDPKNPRSGEQVYQMYMAALRC